MLRLPLNVDFGPTVLGIRVSLLRSFVATRERTVMYGAGYGGFSVSGRIRS
jgi:hypothetical protein